MNDEMECMCMQCGVSTYIAMASISLEVLDGGDTKMVKDTYCTECGGPLIVVGKAGDQPNYRLS